LTVSQVSELSGLATFISLGAGWRLVQKREPSHPSSEAWGQGWTLSHLPGPGPALGTALRGGLQMRLLSGVEVALSCHYPASWRTDASNIWLVFLKSYFGPLNGRVSGRGASGEEEEQEALLPSKRSPTHLEDAFAMNQPAPAALPPPRRVRLKPWLVAQVNSCQYPGLQWVNGEKKCFYIPWRHATRHGPSQDGDNTIFKAWAKETGKYTEGVDEADPAKWKANLRCALNKSRDFRLIYDGPRDMPPQPYKIYEVCSNGPTPAESQPSEDYTLGVGEEEEEEEEELQRMLPSLSLTEAVQPGPPMAPYSLPKEDVKWPPTLQPPVVLGPPAPDPSLLGPAPGNPADFGELLSEVLPSPQPGTLAASLPPTGEQLLPDLLISPHMLPQQVRFPSPEDIPSDKQRFYTNQLLDVLDRGLILQLQGQDLYAIRLCQCKVFWSGPCASAHGSHPNPIQREVVPVAARLLLEMFSGELSWSADSIRLQISNPDLKDRMVEQFKELHHIWQSQQQLQPVAQAPPVAGLSAGQGPWPMHPVGMQ
ncbi:hypothetical protein E2I00_009047, partial [Balaenoptera physalus]